MTFRHIHITGASGSGVTTLGKALAARTGVAHLDTDDFYWRWPPDVAAPYTVKRDVPERLAMLREAFARAGPCGWILSGAVERLWRREKAQFGPAAEPGGTRRREIEDFIAWAAEYDSGTREGRSLPRHEAWLKALACPVLRLDGSDAVDNLVAAVTNG